MPELSKEQLVELITREVMRIMGDSVEPDTADKPGCPDVLVIGNCLSISARSITCAPWSVIPVQRIWKSLKKSTSHS